MFGCVNSHVMYLQSHRRQDLCAYMAASEYALRIECYHIAVMIVSFYTTWMSAWQRRMSGPVADGDVIMRRTGSLDVAIVIAYQYSV